MEELDLRIENGRIFDPAFHRDEIGTIGVRDGKIVSASPETPAKLTVDASGCYVFPGFVDWHTHMFSWGSGFGINPDLFFASGVTTAVDMGSAGHANMAALMHELSCRDMDTQVYMNVSPVGQTGHGVNEPLDDAVLRSPHWKEVLTQYGSRIAGLKLRISKPIVGELGLRPLDIAEELAKEYGLPLCVHTTNPPESQAQVLARLRKGDIFSHVYHQVGYTILDEQGHVLPQAWEAKERGVLFDVGHGRVNFSFAVAEQAIRQGFYPDIISTDATPATYGKKTAYKDMACLISRFLSLGMSLEQVIRCVTVNPAAKLGRTGEIGTLAVGSRADIAICRLKEAQISFVDSLGEIWDGDRILVPCMTIAKGRIVACQSDFGV